MLGTRVALAMLAQPPATFPAPLRGARRANTKQHTSLGPSLSEFFFTNALALDAVQEQSLDSLGTGL